MSANKSGRDPSIRYSEAFKLEVMRELEQDGAAFNQVQRKYGNGTRGRMISVQKPEEIDELARLKERRRRLESALADAHVDLLLERA